MTVMRKISKIISSLVVALSLCLAVLPFTALAAGASIAFSKSSVSVGDTVSVTISVSADSMYGVDVSGSYNEEVLTYVSGASSAGAGIFRITESEGFNGESKKSFTLVFKAKKAGDCTFSVNGEVASGIPPVSVAVSASATMNVKDVTLSNNANLKSLRPGSGSLSPRFSQNVTEYTVNVKNSVTECKLYADTVEPSAKVSVTGSATLKVGENTRVVTVTAPGGATKSYTVKIIRSETEEIPGENTSSTVEASPNLETIINGVTYMVLKDITGVKTPNGFSLAQRLYNNETVSVAVDDNGLFELFYLKSADSDTAYPYIYDSVKNAFKRVQIITQMEKEYIVSDLPENCSLPESYMSANVKINDMSIDCYSNTDEQSSDMFYIYCYYDGEFSMYRYDKLENVLQRYPELEIIESDMANANGNTIIDRFMGLSSNAKTIVVCLIIAILGVIALIVLLIIKLVKSGKSRDFDLLEEDEDFETVSLSDDYQIVDEEEEE